MEQKTNKKHLWGIGIYLSIVIFILWIINFDAVGSWIGAFFILLRPLLIGLGVAYLCNPIFNLFERKVFHKLRPFGLRRGISIFFAYLVMLLIIVLFGALILRGYWIALRAPDRFSCVFAAGLVTQIAVQTVLNMGVVSNLLPSTGVALPFFSYGGTALAVNLAEMGILLSISRHRDQAAQQEELL